MNTFTKIRQQMSGTTVDMEHRKRTSRLEESVLFLVKMKSHWISTELWNNICIAKNPRNVIATAASTNGVFNLSDFPFSMTEM